MCTMLSSNMLWSRTYTEPESTTLVQGNQASYNFCNCVHQTVVLFSSWTFQFMSFFSRSVYDSSREVSNIVDICQSNTLTDWQTYLEVQAWIQPNGKRRQHKFFLFFSCRFLVSALAAVLLMRSLRKMAERFYLPISLSVFLRLSSRIFQNPDLLSGGLLILIWPSSRLVLIQSFGAFYF